MRLATLLMLILAQGCASTGGYDWQAFICASGYGAEPVRFECAKMLYERRQQP